MWDLNLVIAEAADILALNGAKPPAGTDIISVTVANIFFIVSLAFNSSRLSEWLG